MRRGCGAAMLVAGRAKGDPPKRGLRLRTDGYVEPE
jgi:hypothetical protein